MMHDKAHWLWFWAGWIMASAAILLAGCDIPTSYTVHSPECALPPPAVGTVPLGCPYILPDGTVVPGWPQ